MSIRQPVALALVLALAAFATTSHADPRSKWRIEINHKTQNDGVIVFRVAPVGAEPIDVETKVPADTGENHVAKILRDSFKASLGKAYHVEVDDGEDVLVKRRGKTPKFELTLVSSSLTGIEVSIDED